jgi:hypothetical protein
MGRMDVDQRRRTPAYSYVEAAHYLNLPPSTLSSWFRGQAYTQDDRVQQFRPVIRLDGKAGEGSRS